MQHGIAKPEARVYLAIEMNRTLKLKVDGEEIEVELESELEGKKMRQFVKGL